jgi:hypothetical protein
LNSQKYKREIIEEMNGPLKTDRQQIEWRRNQTLELAARGKSQRDISIILQVSEGTTSSDMKWIRLQAQKAIEQHIQQDLPLEHQKAMSGLHQVLKMAWDLSIEERDTRTKLMSLALVNDCYKLIMELSSDARVIKQALAFVNRRLPSKEEEDQVIEEIQNQGEEEEEVTNE